MVKLANLSNWGFYPLCFTYRLLFLEEGKWPFSPVVSGTWLRSSYQVTNGWEMFTTTMDSATKIRTECSPHISGYLRRWHGPQWYILGSWVLIGPEWSRDQDTVLSLGPQWYILGSRQKDPIKDTIQLLGGHSGGGSWGSGDRELDWVRGMSVMMGVDSGTWSGGGYETWHDMMTWHQRDNNIITDDNIRWVIWCLWQTNSPNHWRLKNEGKVLLGAIKWQKGRWPGSTHIVTKCPSPCFKDCEENIFNLLLKHPTWRKIDQLSRRSNDLLVCW